MFRWTAVAALLTTCAQAQTVREWVRVNQPAVLEEFRALLAIPNIASDAPNIARNAETIRAMFEKRGVRTRLLRTPGAPPAVYGERHVNGATHTLAFYAHYDGQPVDPKQWTSAPFDPVVKDGRIYARSSADDKAAIIAMASALDALRASGNKPAVNLKFLFEGEEEDGSPHLAAILRANAELLRADVWLICDGPVHQTGTPQVFFGARGITTLELTVYGASRELHSGHYSGWAPNAAMMLAHLLTSMRDENGRVKIAGFYEGAAPLTGIEKRAIAETPPVEAGLRSELGLGWNENGSRSLTAVINEPSLNVRGLRSVDVGKQARNVVPSAATASIDIRLVKGITPEHALELVNRHVRAQGFFVTETEPDAAMRKQHARIARIEPGHGYAASKTSMDVPVVQEVVRAIEAARGPVVKAPTLGGSVPLFMFEQELRTPFIGVPIANHDSNQHSSNENMRLENLWAGIETMAAIMAMR